MTKLRPNKKFKFLVFSIFIFFVADRVEANSGAPIFGFPSVWGLILTPVIVAIEYFYYKLSGIENPLKKCATINLISSFIGGIITLTTGFLPPISWLSYWDGHNYSKSMLAFIFSIVGSYVVTVCLEYYAVKKLNWSSKLKLNILLRANLMSYSFLAVFIFLFLIKDILF